MGTRRKARELAMQALFFMDQRNDFSAETFGRFCASFAPKPEVRPFFMQLVEGVVQHRDRLDALIQSASENWSLERMSGVDRNVMRIAVFEMVSCEEIPAKVSINEAVDIGKKFGTEDSGAFINGIIDTIRAAIEQGEIRPFAAAPSADAAADDTTAPVGAPTRRPYPEEMS
jgi:transcription antitermination protein NusB